MNKAKRIALVFLSYAGLIILGFILVYFFTGQIDLVMRLDLESPIFILIRLTVYLGCLVVIPMFLVKKNQLTRVQADRLRIYVLLIALIYELLIWI